MNFPTSQVSLATYRNMHPEHLQSNSIGRLHLFEGSQLSQTKASRPHVHEVRSSFTSGFGGLHDSADSGIYSSDSSGFGQQPSSYSMPWGALSVSVFFT